MPSQIMDLIEEYRIKIMFYKNQSDQWRALSIALLLRMEYANGESYVIPANVVEQTANYDIEAEQSDSGEVTVTLTNVT